MEALRKMREEAGFSQTRLAELSGVDRATINKVEHGRRSPSIETLEKLAEALGAEVADFFPKLQAALPFDEPQATRRIFSTINLLVAGMERDTARWRKAATSGKATIDMVEEASAHQRGISEDLLRLAEEANRERWPLAELRLFRRVVFEEAYPPWNRAGEDLLKALIASYTEDELAAVRRRRAETQQAVSATQEAVSATQEALERATRAS